MKKNIRRSMTALAAALCMTASMPAYATETLDLEQMTRELADLQEKASALQSQLDILQTHIDTCEKAIAEATGTDVAALAAEAGAEDAGATSSDGRLGRTLLLNETYTNEVGSFILVYSSAFEDQVQAWAAAEDSLKITPSKGNTLCHVQLIFSSRSSDDKISMGSAFSCYLVADGKKYENGRLLFEAGSADGKDHTYGSYESLVSSGKENFAYLVSAANNNLGTAYNYHSGTYCNLYDYVVEVPADIASTASDVYLQIEMAEENLNFTVPLS